MPISNLSPSPARNESAAVRSLRLATLDDLEGLLRLERDCFDLDRRDSRRSILNSIDHPRYETWVEKVPSNSREIAAALFLRPVRKRLRIYSLSTHPDHRGQGWGNFLVDFAKRRARERQCAFVSLEADASIPELIEWYERKGFRRVKLIESFYGENRHAWRMIYPVESFEHRLHP